MKIQNPSSTEKEEVKKIISKENTFPEKSQPQTKSTSGKNSIQISLDFEKDKEEVHINIHTIVDGKVKETFNVPFSPDGASFNAMWKHIGDEIEKHMRNNPEYYSFGS